MYGEEYGESGGGVLIVRYCFVGSRTVKAQLAAFNNPPAILTIIIRIIITYNSREGNAKQLGSHEMKLQSSYLLRVPIMLGCSVAHSSVHSRAHIRHL